MHGACAVLSFANVFLHQFKKGTHLFGISHSRIGRPSKVADINIPYFNIMDTNVITNLS